MGQHKGSCEVGFVLRVNGQEVIKGMRVGYGSNTRAELLDLWALLLVAVKILVMRIARDSKMIIGWPNEDSNLQAPLIGSLDSKGQIADFFLLKYLFLACLS